MKRIIIFIIAAILTAASAMAASPVTLECERYFGEKYRNNPSTKVTVITNPGNYFRSIKVEANPTLVAEIKKSVEKDRRHADNVTESYSQGKASIILNLPEGVSLGFSDKGEGNCSLYVSGSPDVFRR